MCRRPAFPKVLCVHHALAGARAGQVRQGQTGIGRGYRRRRRRAGRVPRRQLLAGDTAADRQGGSDHAGAASRSRSRRRGQGGSAPCGGLGGGARPLRSCPDRQQRCAGGSRGPAIASWPQSRGACHRAGDGRYRRSLVGAGVRRLIVAGGETSGAVVDRLRIPGLLVGEEIAAGVPVLRAVGAGNGEMLLALKSGNFGGTEFFSDALALMR
jgi:hypothetical protein